MGSSGGDGRAGPGVAGRALPSVVDDAQRGGETGGSGGGGARVVSLARHRPTQDADALEMREVMAALAATATPAQVAVFRRMAGVLWRKAERHQVELRAMLQAMVDGLASKADIGDLKSMVGQLVAQGTTKRADFSAETRRDHENFARNRGGRCPGPGPCRLMVDPSGRHCAGRSGPSSTTSTATDRTTRQRIVG